MQDGFKKFKRFSFRNPKPKRMPFAGGGVSPSNINDNIELPYGGNPEFEPTPIPSYGDGKPTLTVQDTPSGSNPDGFTPMYIGDWHDPVGGDGNSPGSGTVPTGGGDQGNGGYKDYQIFNELGYNPSQPYGSSGSGVPTTRALGFLGNLMGLGAGVFAPGAGPGLSKLGGVGGRMFGRYLANGPLGQPPQQGSNAPPSSAGGNEPYSPFGGLPLGFGEENQHFNNQEGNYGAPNMEWHGFSGPEFHGDNITGGSGSPIVPGSGFLNNAAGMGSLPTLGGGASDYGAKIALHSGRFRDAVANAPYINPNFGMPLPKGGGQGIGGAGRPMTQNYAGGGVAQEDSPTTPEEMAELYAMVLRDSEQKRKEAMNESPARRLDFEPMLPDLYSQIQSQGKGKTDISFARGGMVRPVPMPQQVQGMGSDTVPAALTPGELVLDNQQQSAVMPRPGMKRMLKPEQRAAIEIAMRKKKQEVPPR